MSGSGSLNQSRNRLLTEVSPRASSNASTLPLANSRSCAMTSSFSTPSRLTCTLAVRIAGATAFDRTPARLPRGCLRSSRFDSQHRPVTPCLVEFRHESGCQQRDFSRPRRRGRAHIDDAVGEVFDLAVLGDLRPDMSGPLGENPRTGERLFPALIAHEVAHNVGKWHAIGTMWSCR